MNPMGAQVDSRLRFIETGPCASPNFLNYQPLREQVLPQVSTRKLDRVMSTYRKDDHYLGLSADDYREIESNLEALEGLVNDNVLNQSSWNESGRCG
jgi:hypothetical protein